MPTTFVTPGAEPATSPNGASPAAPEPLLTSVLYLARRWPVLLRWMLAGACLAGAIAALRPRQYVATAAFVPVSRSATPSNVSALVGTLGLSGLQADAEGPQFYADLIRSPELLLAPMRQRLAVGDSEVRGRTLVDLYGGSANDSTVREDRALEYVATKVVGTTITAKTGVVRLNVKTRWAPVSQWLARRLLDQLDDFNIENRRTQAGQERRFAEQLLQARRDSLRLAENRFQGFVLGNREYSNSPTLTLEAERLRRETSLQLSLLTSATSQYEEARLREVRDTPTIMVIEAPRTPARSLPKLVGPIAAFGGVLGVAVAVLGMLFVRAVSVQRSLGDPEAEQLFRSVSRFRRGSRERPAVRDLAAS